MSRLYKLLNDLELFRLALNSMSCATTITDPSGNILFLSTPFANFVGVPPAEAAGRPCLDIVPSSRMHIVGRTGVAEINDLQVILGKQRLVQRIPLKRDGKIIGVVSQLVFKEYGELSRILQKFRPNTSAVLPAAEPMHTVRYTMADYVGESTQTQVIRQKALRLAQTDLPILLLGESGTGKEVLAQAIHHASTRSQQRFVRINCANISRELFESELFGYESGAFTGAKAKGHPGKFEFADKGTIFLDEIGEMPPAMQAKLLSVLEEKSFYRVGGNTLVKVDFRLIAATNQDLQQCIAAGRFRNDLFYRLCTTSIHLPPLRERPRDIAPIVQHILRSRATAQGVASISREALQCALAYTWPGNVRELVNCIESALALCNGNRIKAEDMPIHHNAPPTPPHEEQAASKQDTTAQSANDQPHPLSHDRDDAERKIIKNALNACNWNKSRAAAMLRIHRSLLYRRMSHLGITREP